MSNAGAEHQLQVDDKANGERIDRFVGERLGLSRAKVKTLFEAGQVRIDGRRSKKGETLEAGQRVTVHIEPEGEALVPEPSAPLTVLREDSSLIFVDKSSGMPTHPLKPGERGTLANALVARYPECRSASEDPREGGFCHRLDIETSGVIVAARSASAWNAVREAFTQREVEKKYWALVTGPIADDGTIELPLRHRSERVEPALDGIDARDAQSTFRVLARRGETSFVEVAISTGVLHQVRAHLAAIGAPIVGDTLYGGKAAPDLGRFFLHARSLALVNPETKQQVRVESPLPPSLQAIASELGIK